MAKFLYQASYTDTGLEGLLKEGGSSRRKAVEQTARSLGGTVEAFYYAFGETDVYLIGEAPDNATAAAIAMAVNASGAVKVNTVVLMTPEEVDEATEKTVSYRPPGH